MIRMMKMVRIQVLLLVLPVFGWAGQIPDTGQTKCYDNSVEIPCPSPGEMFHGQDAQYDGPARSYTKLGQNGVELPDTATQQGGEWIMTRDNVTGLIWEIKTDDGLINDKDNTYTWYDSDSTTNGGYAGLPGEGTDTEDFINALNDAVFGGYSDWRMPTIKELASLVNSSVFISGPTIDTEWFPHTMPFYYWSSTTRVENTGHAWRLFFDDGQVGCYLKSYRCHVRGVRAGH